MVVLASFPKYNMERGYSFYTSHNARNDFVERSDSSASIEKITRKFNVFIFYRCPLESCFTIFAV